MNYSGNWGIAGWIKSSINKVGICHISGAVEERGSKGAKPYQKPPCQSPNLVVNYEGLELYRLSLVAN